MLDKMLQGVGSPKSTYNPEVFRRVNDFLLSDIYNMYHYCGRWGTGGHLTGTEYVCLGRGGDGKSTGSLCLNLRHGRWVDFSAEIRGSDPVSYHAYVFELTQIEAVLDLVAEFGLD